MNILTMDAQGRQALLQRVADILLRPARTWPQIDTEDGSAAHLYRSYLIYLAALPAVAAFIGMSLVGVGALGMRIRVPIAAGLVNLVVSYGLSLALAYALALVANALAPRFQGRQDMDSALKLIAYAATAGLLAGVFSTVPVLGLLAIVGGLYSIYLLYLGAPVLMKVPRQRALSYTAVLLLCGVVMGVVAGALGALLTPGTHAGNRASLGVPGSGLRIGNAAGTASGRSGDSAATQAATEALGAMLGTRIDVARLEQAGRQREQANARGDSEGAAKATGEMLSAALGGQGLPALSTQQLRAVAPQELAGLPRTAIKAASNSMMGMDFTQLEARYGQGPRHVELRLKDIGAAPALAMGMASWASGTSESEDEREIERSYKKAGVRFREKYRKDGSRSELSLLLPNRVVLEAQGTLPIDTLKQALQPVIGHTSALARAAP